MKLSYRGVSYEHEPLTLEVTEGEILGKYRGAGWHCHTLNEMPVPRADQVLKYRGVAYHTDPNAEASRQAAAQPTHSTAISSTSTQSKVVKPVASVVPLNVRRAVEETHRENLRRNLEHRLQAAKAQGDQHLVNMLEAESRQLLV